MYTGQNLQMALMGLKVVQLLENNIKITKLLSGNSHLPNDADFGIIEMAMEKITTRLLRCNNTILKT